MIPSRNRREVVETLKRFPGARTVTRDFSRTYKSAIKEALPNAEQIVDRFHILKNLTEHVSDYLKRKVKNRIKILDPLPVPISEKEILNARERKKVETGLKKWETAKEAQRLKRSGKNNTEIAKTLQISRPTVIKYLAMTKPPIASRPCKLDPHIPRIKELILSGHSYMEIFNKIKEEGYTGEISLYNSKMKGIRWEAGHGFRYIKRSDIKKLLYAPLENIQDEWKQRDIELYLEKETELAQVLKLASGFKTLLFGKDEGELDSWMQKAEGFQIAEINSFLKLIRSDMEAVKNAIKYSYSNGPAEGHNNKIKMIKRQMYGRCKFDLLRLKILC